jgi:GAF domain-containing protein
VTEETIAFHDLVSAKIEGELRAWRVQVLNVLLIVTAAAATVVVANSVAQAIADPQWWPQTVPFLAGYAILLALTVLRRLDYRIRIGGFLLIGYAVAIMYMGLLGLLGNGMIFLLALPALAVLLVGVRTGIALAVTSLLIYGAFAIAAATGWLGEWLVVTENTLALSQWGSQGLSFALLLGTLVFLQALFGRSQMTALRTARETAEQLGVAHDQVQFRTDELSRYARLLEAATEIAHEVTGLLERQELLERAVQLVARRLELDRVAVYLLDPLNQEISLAAAAGQEVHEAGGEPEAQGDQEEVPPAVVWASTTKKVQGEASASGQELALPLTVGGVVIGVMDVYATRLSEFDETEVAALQAMADQLAVALENARLFADVQSNLREIDALYRHYTAEAWQRFVDSGFEPIHRWRGAGDVPDEAWRDLFDEVRATGRPVTKLDTKGEAKGAQYLLAVPIRLRDAGIGVLGFYRPAAAGAWGMGEIAAVEAIASRLGFATDNLRLLKETQRRAARDRIVDQITGKVQATMDLDTILKTAVRELGGTLGASSATIEITGIQGAERERGDRDGGGRSR